ncbi:uncharacterized protein LOC110361832 [Columba livia]|uniref:uncharacterized protein LOC110361832 n=1 Tax=Columba livia TaxID=8932 RepID=UPI0031BA1A7E
MNLFGLLTLLSITAAASSTQDPGGSPLQSDSALPVLVTSVCSERNAALVGGGAAACCMPADEIQPLVPARLWPHPCGRVRYGHGRHSLCGKGKLLARQREINRRRPAMTKTSRLSFHRRDIRWTSKGGAKCCGKGLIAQTIKPSSLPGRWKEKAAPMLLKLPRLRGRMLGFPGGAGSQVSSLAQVELPDALGWDVPSCMGIRLPKVSCVGLGTIPMAWGHTCPCSHMGYTVPKLKTTESGEVSICPPKVVQA